MVRQAIWSWRVLGVAVIVALVISAQAGSALAQGQQGTGAVAGRVTLESSGEPLEGASVVVLTLGRSATTDADGRFEIAGVPPGSVVLVAQREHLTSARQSVTVTAGATADAAIVLRISPVHEELTVTAGLVGAASAFDAFNTVTSLDSSELARRPGLTLADMLQREPSVQVRSFGPGTTRPIIRGFDGDRVLIMQDGIRTGDLSSQSADHGTTIDPASLERLEVVKGPATLLYGSNAIGGVVNAVTPQEAFLEAPFTGLRGQVFSNAGSTNGQAASSANVQWGAANGWNVWAAAGSRRVGDYSTPIGEIVNSEARFTNGRVGVGYSRNQRFFSVGYEGEQGRYGVPFGGAFHGHEEEHDETGEGEDDHEGEGEGEEEVTIDLKPRRHVVRADAGLRQLGNRLINGVRVTASYLDWRHDEIEVEGDAETLGTQFTNKHTIVRADFDQQRAGRLTGRFGVSTFGRDYAAIGEEALAPETSQRTSAVFAYEEVAMGPARLMFGGRYEHTNYDTVERDGPSVAPSTGGHQHGVGGLVPPAVRDRSYGGASGSVGLRVNLRPGTALVSTLSRSFRAPALEELYNFGPHVGNLAFEIGNANLEREASLGIDLSLRHRSARVTGDLTVFRYGIDNFIFPQFSVSETIEGLRVGDYRQDDAAFTGTDASVSLGLHRYLWLNASVGIVRAELTTLNQNVPRIPPAHGRVGLTLPVGQFSVSPEVAWAAKQDRIAVNETPTNGYAVFNINAAYTLAQTRRAHIFSVDTFNVGDRLYRNHTSLIKDLAPELGRGVRFSYAIKFF